MPIIAVNLGDVIAFENLPSGSYLGEIEKVDYRESNREGKFAQLQVTYLVIDGDQLGNRQSEWLSLSPKAAWRLKRWFAKFGFGEEADLDIDDDTGQLNSPYVVGSRVIFLVRPDGTLPSGEARIRTELVSVEEVPGVAAPPVVNIRRPATVQPVPAVQIARPQRRPAAPAPAIVEDEAEEEETVTDVGVAPAPAVARRVTLRPAAGPPVPAGPPQPVRRIR